MPLAWRLDDDATCGDAAEPLLQNGDVLHYAGTQLLASFEALKVDLDGGLHAGSPKFLASSRAAQGGFGCLAQDGHKRRAALLTPRVRQTLGKAQEDAAL